MAKKNAGQATGKQTEKRQKATRGTSINAQAKQLFLQMFADYSETNAIDPATWEKAINLHKEIPASQLRGLPLETQLANKNAAIAALYENVPVNPETGKADFSGIDAQLRPLMAEAEKLQKAIDAKKKKDASAPESGENANKDLTA